MLTEIYFETFINILFVLIMLIQIAAAIDLARRFDKRSDLLRSARWMLISVFALSIVYFYYINAQNLTLAQWGLCISFVIFDLVICSFYYFVEVFTGTHKTHKKRITIVISLQIIDMIAVFSSIFNNYVYTAVPIEIANNTYYSYTTGPLHSYLYVLTFTALVIAVGKLVMMAIKSPKRYRRQYLYVVFGVLFLVVLNMLFAVLGVNVVDMSGMFVAAVITLTYYFAVISLPTNFIRTSRANVIDEMYDGIIIYDYNGQYFDSNKVIKGYLGVDKYTAYDVIPDWVNRRGIDIRKQESIEITEEEFEGSPTVLVASHPYYEEGKNNVYLGSYIRIHDRTEEIKKTNEALYNATHDSLTGLLSREAFFDEVQKILEALPEIDHYLVCANIENFKLYNTLFGIEAGNIFLKQIALSIENNIHEYNCVGRMEADRFCVLMPRKAFDEREFKLMYADALSHTGNKRYPIRSYLGVHKITDLSQPVFLMYNRTLMAAQSIKGHAEKYTCFYDQTIGEQILKEQNKIDEIKKALDNDEFVFYIQPQVTPNGDIPGGEALVRWNHPTKGIISPFFFISSMEEHGLIERLDYLVWEKVCKKLKEWKEAGIDQYISVNISAKDFYYMDIYKTFGQLVEKYGVDKDKIKLEITESAIMLDENKQIAVLEKLRNAGFTVEMDDFGSGFSSLNMLNKMHVDILKLDMGFLQSDDDERSKTILANIQNLASQLGIETVAEGVETKEQADFLISIGCNLLQGYLYSPPIAVEEYESRFANNKYVLEEI